MQFYSQWGQDKKLYQDFFKYRDPSKCFFVDVGAHDGVEINNTLFYEKLGWNGICIEPLPHRYKELIKNRKCKCINACAYNQNIKVKFNCISGYSEMLSGIVNEYNDKHKQRIEEEIKVAGGKQELLEVDGITLEKIFDDNKITHVDYLSIDVEGAELKVLEGINFKKVKFDVIEAEDNYKESSELIVDLLKQNGYKVYARVGGDLIFVPE